MKLASCLCLLVSVVACSETSRTDPEPAHDAGVPPPSDAAAPSLPEPKSLVWVGAHPDDELYAAPWLGYLCIEKQASCTFLVLTRGEAGNCKLPNGCTPDLATVRDSELAASANLFGAKLVHWDLGDGTAGDPAVVLENWAAKLGSGDQLLADVRSIVSGVDRIVTFDPRHGDSCHADHRAAAALAIYVATELAQPVGVTMVASKQITSLAAADPAVVSFDATRVLEATTEPAWSVLVSVLEAHASQFTPDEVTTVKNVPVALRKTHLLDLAHAIDDDPAYANVCP